MSKQKLNIENNRHEIKYPFNIQIKRVLWGGVYPIFRFSPRVMFSWRSFLLKIFGANVGKNVHIYNTAKIYFPWNLEIGDWSAIGEYAFIYNLGMVRIGKKVTISQRAHLCAGTHNYNDSTFPLITQPILISDQAWVAADAFIGPGVSIGEGAVVGARAVVVKTVEPWTVVAGNPARFIKKRLIKDD